MRDDVDLIADHYAPTDASKAKGTLLVRGPYGRGYQTASLFARPYAARGYHVVLQSVRGTGYALALVSARAPPGADI